MTEYDYKDEMQHYVCKAYERIDIIGDDLVALTLYIKQQMEMYCDRWNPARWAALQVLLHKLKKLIIKTYNYDEDLYNFYEGE